MVRNLLILSFFVLLGLAADAQTVFSGRVLENKTRVTLNGVRIENLNNKLKALSDETGHFSIGAKVGDLIVFKAFSYQPDTLLVTDLHDKEVFLTAQQTMLNQVTITDSSANTANAAKNMVLPYDPEFHGQTMIYQRDPKTGAYSGGVILRMHYFKGDEHKKKKAEQKAQERILSEEISKIFTSFNIGHYVPLKGEDLDNFVLLYTPDIKFYNSDKFNLTDYLSTSYKTWLTLTDEQRKAGQIFKKQ